MRKIHITVLFIFSCWMQIAAQQYNPEKAVAYANKWWNSFNTDKDNPVDGGPYKNYTRDGGDCANFVSQCLIAGGLNLKGGTDGKGAYVKPEGVIAGAKELVKHLKDVQKFEHKLINNIYGKEEPLFVKPGDPVFLGYELANHSTICVDVERGKNVYNAHTGPHYHEKITYWGYPNAYYFHIGTEITYPAHCSNCQRDGDETDVDCGGSCPVCEDEPMQRVVTAGNLKQINAARDNLSTSGILVIASDQEVKFLSGNEININSGFELRDGSEFVAEITKDRDKLVRGPREVCVYTPNAFSPNGDGINDIYGFRLVGIVHIEIFIFDRSGSEYYNLNQSVNRDGYFAMWNGKARNILGNLVDAPTGAYFFVAYLTDHDENQNIYTGHITLLR